MLTRNKNNVGSTVPQNCILPTLHIKSGTFGNVDKVYLYIDYNCEG